MSDTKKSEVVETKTTDVAVENGKLICQIRKAKEKISRDLEVTPSELVIRNTAELVAIRAIRDTKNREKIGKTQRLMSKFRGFL